MAERENPDWLEDFSRPASKHTIGFAILEAEKTVVFMGSKPAAAVWLTVTGALGGVFGGVLVSGTLWRPLWPAAVYFATLPVAWLGMRRITLALFGPAIGWQAVLAFFWAFVVAMAGVIGGHFSSLWLAYGLSLGAGLFIGLPFAGVPSPWIKHPDAWMVGLPLCGMSTTIGTYVCRANVASIQTASMAGAVSGLILTAPMTALLMKLWDVTAGIGKVAAICLQHDAYLAKAIEYLDRGIQSSPDDAELHNLRAMAWSRAGDVARADADWQKVIQLQPTSAQPYLTQGLDCLTTDRVERAVALLEKAVELAPKNGMAHHGLGVALERQGELDRAMTHLDRAVVLRAKDPRAYADRARAHLRAGRHQQAIEDCDAAIELEPATSAALLTRAHAHAASGHRELAAEDYQSVREMDQTEEEFEEAEKGLRALGLQPE